MFGKPKSMEEMIGMADTLIGMATGGNSSVETLTAEYMPKLVETVKAYENPDTGSSMMLTVMLDESKTFFVASIFELMRDGNAIPKAAYPINSLKEVLDIFKNLKQDAETINTISAAAEPIAAPTNEGNDNGSDEHSTGAENDGREPGADTDSGTGGLPQNTNDGGTPPLS